MWNVEWTVLNDGSDREYAGRKIFDRWVFSEKALPRIKLICSRLGFDVSGDVELELTVDVFLERTALVEVFTDEYEDKTGRTKKTNRVSFDGYSQPGDSEVTDNDGAPQQPIAATAGATGMAGAAAAKRSRPAAAKRDGAPF
jgi:hypothetical protein